MKIETTLEQMRDDYDWQEVWRYANGDTTQQQEQNAPDGVLGYQGDVGRFAIDDVAELLGSSDGEHDERDWVCFGRLKDGRFFSIKAGCDYTGWDCQSGGQSLVADSLEAIVSLGLDEESRKRMTE